MRYFVLGFILFCAAVVGIAGFRGDISRKPPIEIFADMDRQPKLRPQADSSFFEDGVTSRKPVLGTVKRGAILDESEFTTGKVPGTTNYVTALPIKVTERVLESGQHNYNVYCAPCHGAQGDGQGIVSKYGIAGVANFHSEPLVKMTDGQIYDAITHGAKPQPNGTMRMPSYATSISIEDRWAVVAYVRALQRGRLANIEDVPQDARKSLNP